MIDATDCEIHHAREPNIPKPRVITVRMVYHVILKPFCLSALPDSLPQRRDSALLDIVERTLDDVYCRTLGEFGRLKSNIGGESSDESAKRSTAAQTIREAMP